MPRGLKTDWRRYQSDATYRYIVDRLQRVDSVSPQDALDLAVLCLGEPTLDEKKILLLIEESRAPAPIIIKLDKMPGWLKGRHE